MKARGRPLFWTDERIRRAHRLYVERGWSLLRVSQHFRRRNSSHSLRDGFHRLGLAVREHGGTKYQPRPLQGANPDPKRPREIRRGIGHRCIHVDGRCLGCGAARAAMQQ